MVVADLPFRVQDQAVVAKEVFNSYYQRMAPHVASIMASGCVDIGLRHGDYYGDNGQVQSPFKFFLDSFLALNCAEALVQLATLLVSNYIVGIAALAWVSR